MKAINGTDDNELAVMQVNFVSAMEAACRIFGRDAFRKRFDKEAGV